MTHCLVIAEHVDGRLQGATHAAVGFAQKVRAESEGRFEILLMGDALDSLTQAVAYLGADAVRVASSPELKHLSAERCAAVIAEVARQAGANLVVAGASTFSKDVLPRAAALIDAGMVSDVVGVRAEGADFVFRRVMHAGNIIGTVKLEGAVKMLTVRAAAFSAGPSSTSPSPVLPHAVDTAKLPVGAKFVGRDARAGGRPDPTEARVVVTGGRAFKNAEDFERLVGGLADALGGAVGSSRALVDAGITPNALQVGQTGKVVAPELYIALGVSGAIQHVAGIRDAKIVVAINQDADAPIFEVADYGLVADVYAAVPELITKLRKA